jgi:hypothetical protein
VFDQAEPRGHQLPTRLQAPGPRAGLLGRAGCRTVVVMVVGTFLLSLVAAAVGRPPGLIAASGAERFIGPDGHRTVLASTRPAGTVSAQVRQTGHQAGNRAWSDGPWWFYLGLADLESATEHYWVVETEDDSGGDTPHLMRLDGTGLSTRVAGWPQIRYFDPTRPEVPADPRPGQRIITTGRTQTLPEEGGVTEPYSSVLEVSDAADVGPGCLGFRRTDTLGTAAPVTSSRVRCPERGVVRLELPTGRWDAVAGWPEGDDPRRTVNLTPPPPGPLRGLVPTPIQFSRGLLPAEVPAAGPLLSPGGNYVLAAAATGNLLWLTPGGQQFEMTAWVDVGGDIVGVAECGNVVVAATTRRTVMAHDAEGRWLWTTELADVAGSNPVRAGDALLVATKDGRLTALGCRDGAVRWGIDGVGSTVSPAVGPTGVLVAGDGRVRLLDPVTGQQRWERNLPAQPRAVGFLGSLAVAADGDDIIHGLTGADGVPVWTHRLAATVVELHDLGEVVAVRTGTGFVGIDRRGQRRWQDDFRAMESLSDGRQVFAADLGGIVVIDAAGRTVERTEAPMHPVAASLHLARTPTGVTVVDPLGTMIDWRLP